MKKFVLVFIIGIVFLIFGKLKIFGSSFKKNDTIKVYTNEILKTKGRIVIIVEVFEDYYITKDKIIISFDRNSILIKSNNFKKNKLRQDDVEYIINWEEKLNKYLNKNISCSDFEVYSIRYKLNKKRIVVGNCNWDAYNELIKIISRKGTPLPHDQCH